jgi:hypothetical protein
MARSEALVTARRAYERAHVWSAARGIALAGGITALALALGRTTHTTWIIASVLAATLAVLGWRGGAWRRGALAGVLAGLPPLVAPTIVFALSHGGHCPDCEMGPSFTCLMTCFGTSALVGLFVGHAATRDAASHRFAAGALASAIATGLLGCSTTGLGGAAGIVIGLVAGSVTGWFVAGRAAHA